MNLELLEKSYNDAIKNIPPAQKNLRAYLLRRTLESRLERVKRIRKATAVSQFDLVFIGKVGTGKTTAICSLFGLRKDFERGKAPKVKIKTEPLLTTGSGRSTICEVEIKRDSHTALEIDPLSENEMHALLEDFGDSIFARLRRDKFDSSQDGLSAEVERAIRNIVSMPKDSERDGKRFDSALEQAQEAGDELSFLNILQTKADLLSRTKTRLDFESGNEHEWLKDTFKDINVGKKEGFSIPKKIRILLGPTFTSSNEHANFIQNVIDTKGLDEILIRADIDSYVERENTLCLFTSGFSGAPDGEALGYIERLLLDRTSGFDRRCILLVLSRNGEAAQALDSNGSAVDDEQAGEKIKLDHILNAFQNKGISFLPENVIFYDAQQGFSSERLENKELAEEAREMFFQKIEHIIDSRQRYFERTAKMLEEDLERLRDGNSPLIDKDKKIVEKACYLLQQSEVRISTEKFIYSLMAYLREKCKAIQFHALNRRFGIYNDVSVFDVAQEITKSLVRRATRDELERVSKQLLQLSDESSNEVKPFLSELHEQLQIHYESYLKKVAIFIRDSIENNLQPLEHSNEFWRAVISQWGKGPGYWDRVSNDYHQKLEEIEVIIYNTASSYWKKDVTELLGSFLSEN